MIGHTLKHKWEEAQMVLETNGVQIRIEGN